MNITEQEIPTKAVEMFSKGLTAVYKDAREKALKHEKHKYGYFNKKNAAIYLGVFPLHLRSGLEDINREVID